MRKIPVVALTLFVIIAIIMGAFTFLLIQSKPLELKEMFYQDNNKLCFVLKNPNESPVNVSDLSIHINGKIYIPTLKFDAIPPRNALPFCVVYVPSGGEEVEISVNGTKVSAHIPKTISTGTTVLYCSSCGECTSKIDIASHLVHNNPNKKFVIFLTQNISSSSTCISISNSDLNKLVIFDGGGHTITGSGKGEGIRIFRVSGFMVKDISIHNFHYGIYILHSSLNTLKNVTVANNDYGIFLYSSSDNVSLLDSNTYACGNTTDIYLNKSKLNCINCGNGYYFHYNTVYGSGINCDCNASCP